MKKGSVGNAIFCGVIYASSSFNDRMGKIYSCFVFFHSSAGVGRTGVFCALSYLIERLKTEHVIDVFQTVKTLRQKRPAMVQTKVSSFLTIAKFCFVQQSC